MKPFAHFSTIAPRILAIAALTVALSAPAAASVSTMVGKEAHSLRTDAAELLSLAKKGDFDTLRSEVDDFRAKADALVQRIETYHDQSSTWTEKQRESYDLMLRKAELLSQMAGTKADLIDDDPDAYRRKIRHQAKNLVIRAKLLAKAAASSPIPATAAAVE